MEKLLVSGLQLIALFQKDGCCVTIARSSRSASFEISYPAMILASVSWRKMVLYVHIYCKIPGEVIISGV